MVCGQLEPRAMNTKKETVTQLLLVGKRFHIKIAKVRLLF